MPLSQREPRGPSLLRLQIAAVLLLRPDLEAWHGDRPPFLVDRHHRDVGRVRVAAVLPLDGLRFDANAHFDRSAPHRVHTGSKRHHFADQDGRVKVHLVEAYGYAQPAGVTGRAHVSDPVHGGQNHSPEHVPREVDVLRRHELGHRDARELGRTCGLDLASADHDRQFRHGWSERSGSCPTYGRRERPGGVVRWRRAATASTRRKTLRRFPPRTFSTSSSE